MKKAKWIVVFLTVGAGVFAAGCGGTSAGYSCTTDSGGAKQCVEYSGSTYANEVIKTSTQTACSGTGQTFSSSGCSGTDRLGTCMLSAGTADETVQSYYSPSSTASAAEATCQSIGGSWAAGA